MYCAASGCPLNETTLDESSNGLELIISFIASTHQPEHVFTPSQLEQIYREIVAQVQKYKETREATRAVYGDAVVADQSDFGLVAAAQSEAENESDVFANQNQYDRHSALGQNEMAKDSWGNGGCVQDRHLPPQNQSLESEHELDSSIQEYHQQLLGSKPLPFDAMSLHDEEEEELSRHHAAEHSPYVQVCFRELLSQTGFLGLRKKDRLHKLSSVLSRPLGCCYDEVRKCWAIADSANNRILLYPEGVTIESPKFVNPSTVCVLQPGKVLGVLSDTCLATYTYDNNEVAIIVESYGGAKIRCRGLARTPRGNLVTILKKNFNTSEAIIYDAAHPSRYGQVVGRVSFPGASASFCAMNGRRLVVTDLGNQTLTMLEFNEAETSASIKQTTPFKWGSKGEPNGGFDFVSGVQVDSDGWSIVADAGGRTVQLFDEDLKFVTRLGSDFPLPYTSAIAINNFNEVMFIGRKNNEVTLATLEPFSDLPSLMGSSSSFSHSTAPTTTNPARFGNALPTSTTGAAANPPNITTSRFGDNKSAFPSRTFNGPAKSSSSFGSNISTFR